MIVKKCWKRYARNKLCAFGYERRYYRGWFLFGFIPLYVDRYDVKF